MMAPAFLTGLYGLLVGAAPYMALGCFVAATVSFRGRRRNQLRLGGRVHQMIFWGMVFLSLQAIPTVLTAAGIPLQTPGTTSTSSPYLSGLLTLVQNFTSNYLVSHLVPVIGAALVLKALLDSAEGNSPIPSLVSALACSLRAGSLDDGKVLEPVLGPVRRGRWADESCELVWE